MVSQRIITRVKQLKSKRMKNKILLFLLVFQVGWAQQKSLSSTEYWQIVQHFHPVVKQTLLDNKQTNATLTFARGLPRSLPKHSHLVWN
jgi:hypothetical protein